MLLEREQRAREDAQGANRAKSEFLALARGMGGDLTVRSTLREGSVFTLSLQSP
jgi:hypothetical protein